MKVSKVIFIFFLATFISCCSVILLGNKLEEEVVDPIKVFFAFPASNREDEEWGFPERKIKREIAQLGKDDKLYIAMYNFEDKKLGQAVRDAACENGVEVKVYLEKDEGVEKTEVFAMFKYALESDRNCNIQVKGDTCGPNCTGKSYKMHHKFVVIRSEDEKLIITGSYNWSKAAWDNNFENVLFIRDEKTFKEYEDIFWTLWTDYSINLLN